MPHKSAKKKSLHNKKYWKYTRQPSLQFVVEKQLKSKDRKALGKHLPKSVQVTSGQVVVITASISTERYVHCGCLLSSGFCLDFSILFFFWEHNILTVDRKGKEMTSHNRRNQLSAKGFCHQTNDPSIDIAIDIGSVVPPMIAQFAQ